MTIPEIIDRIEAGKKAACIFPFHATRLDIVELHGNREEVRSELNRLHADGKIEVGRTINDKYVRVVGRSYNE